jgi:hypothetical protein
MFKQSKVRRDETAEANSVAFKASGQASGGKKRLRVDKSSSDGAETVVERATKRRRV